MASIPAPLPPAYSSSDDDGDDDDDDDDDDYDDEEPDGHAKLLEPQELVIDITLVRAAEGGAARTTSHTGDTPPAPYVHLHARVVKVIGRGSFSAVVLASVVRGTSYVVTAHMQR